MAGPVLVRAYSGTMGQSMSAYSTSTTLDPTQTLPPISSYAFASILKEVTNAELQQTIDAIADICAKNSMSLAGEYGSHMPPVGEIVAGIPAVPRSYAGRRETKRALTSVPEASSSGSEGGRTDTGHVVEANITRPRQVVEGHRRNIIFGCIGRTVGAKSIAVLAQVGDETRDNDLEADMRVIMPHTSLTRSSSEATSRLRHLLGSKT
ncbi:hypothetical protein LTR62_008495 [Meristemomyces frigidus]|uniref:Uncharacterized protein n=1 Tax=Meristemomyces frigidus TaxID=1508187 RepID=A0AAN7TLS3_9PEZI|nr:hypothetical protein LTR62_008495 [Meristemomyces frigidus]